MAKSKLTPAEIDKIEEKMDGISDRLLKYGTIADNIQNFTIKWKNDKMSEENLHTAIKMCIDAFVEKRKEVCPRANSPEEIEMLMDKIADLQGKYGQVADEIMELVKKWKAGEISDDHISAVIKVPIDSFIKASESSDSSPKVLIGKNCPICRYYKMDEKVTIERGGKIISSKYYPPTCLNGKHEIMLNWFKTKKPIELSCFEPK